MFSFPLGKYIGIELTGHSKYMFNFIRNYQIVFQNEYHFTCHFTSKILKFQLLHMLVNICITYFSKVFGQIFPFLQKLH